MPDQGVAAAPPTVQRERRLDLDRARGIAILLVVFGHIVAQRVPPGIEWYEPVRYLVYCFHMPFFLYLSGTVVALSNSLAKPPGRVVRQRAVRLLVPFFAIGIAIFASKLIAVRLVHVDNPPQGLMGGLRDLFWTTSHSPATSVWYLLVLFLCTLVAMGLRRLGVGSTGFLVLGFSLQLIDVPAVAYLDRFASHFLFFAAGLWVAEREERFLPLFERWQVVWWAVFAAALTLAALGWVGPRLSAVRPGPAAAPMILCGLSCIPALHGAMRLAPVAQWKWPLVLGGFSMAIYLFNTLAIGGTKAVLMKLGFGWTEAWFPLHAVAAMTAGVALPVLLKVLVLRRVPAVDRLTD